jgi:hypothetical protein
MESSGHFFGFQENILHVDAEIAFVIFRSDRAIIPQQRLCQPK